MEMGIRDGPGRASTASKVLEFDDTIESKYGRWALLCFACKVTPMRIILSYVVVPAQAMMPVPDKYNRCSVNVHKKEG